MLATHLKRFAKDSVIYGMGDALGRMIGLIMLPILSRAFVPADYGAIDLLTVIYTFVLDGVSLNLEPGINRQYHNLDKGGRKTLLSSTCFFNFSIAIGCTLLIVVASPSISRLIVDSSDLALPIIVLACCLPLENLFTKLQLLLRMQSKAVLFTATNIAGVVITPLLTYIMVIVFQTGIIGVFYSKLITAFILTIFTFVLERQQFGATLSLEVFLQQVRFTMPGYPGMMIKQFMAVLPRMLLAAFAPLVAVGLYGIAFRVSQLMTLFVNAFNRAWGPFAFSQAGSPDERRIYSIVFKLFALVLLLLGLGLSLYAREVIMILTPPQYHGAHYLVGGVVLYLGLRGLTMIFGTALYIVEQVKWISYNYIILLLLFVVAALLLVPKYQTTGLIISLNFSVFVYFSWSVRIIQRHFPFTIPLVRLSLLLIISAATVTFFKFITGNFFFIIILKLAAFMLLALLSIILLLDKEEKEKALQIINSVFKLQNSKNIAQP